MNSILNAQPAIARPIQPREKLDFGLDGDIPRHWAGGDIFKTRFFDAMSTTFPIGERYFITSCRAFRDQIQDPKLLAEVRDFIRQEGQHGMVHGKFNDMLTRQGIDLEFIEGEIARHVKFFNDNFSKEFNLAVTAAFEHLTAMMCSTFIEREDIIGDWDHRIRAMYTWHAIEEVEHKAVCFDVMQKVAKVGYFKRVAAMLLVSVMFPLGIMRIMNRMFQADKLSLWQQAKTWAKGLWWMHKPGGAFLPAVGFYLAYFKPGFHPWQHPEMTHYDLWVNTLETSGSPIAASEALMKTFKAA